jgi:hypothetical protein
MGAILSAISNIFDGSPTSQPSKIALPPQSYTLPPPPTSPSPPGGVKTEDQIFQEIARSYVKYNPEVTTDQIIQQLKDIINKCTTCKAYIALGNHVYMTRADAAVDNRNDDNLYHVTLYKPMDEPDGK